MTVSATFKANVEFTKIVGPRVSSFDNPSKSAELTTVSGPTLCDDGLDVPVAKRLTMRLGIVAAIGADDFGLLKWPATYASNRGNRLDKRQQLGDFVPVRASFSPAPKARTDEESTAAREKSSWPASRNFASNISYGRSHTPASCRSRSLRQLVAPESKPRLVGKWFQRSPVLNTNRAPLSAARSDTRSRPRDSLRRSFRGGSKGSISIHNSSSMSGACILDIRCSDAGQVAGIMCANEMVEHLRTAAVIADKGYDSDAFAATIRAAGAKVVIPPRSNRTTKRRYSRVLYRTRNIVERFFNRIELFRRLATRYDKLAGSHLAFASLACAFGALVRM